ncbi:PadR family transcriptional regulator [Actinomadura craniellae]|uniref:PadR family transcriptional regulator n=1 Tax=Actinomadura craniellae TaxID=2231787 RepID=A0A365H312_9ACTN|nr:PadR family transcriptional regulator [Actinomadura craniellae]RAY13439.1 PadR family transcriptional regulator [Actinomadura craniellae]
MTPVFGHGRLRLYLLKLLEESPRHGYEVIRLLRDRFMGIYSPSPGTIYPRLARLEREGLVTHEVVKGKKVYSITDDGRAELDRRMDELAELEAEISASAQQFAREVQEDVRETVRSLREELTRAVREVREQGPLAAEQTLRDGARRQKDEWRRQKDQWRRHQQEWRGHGRDWKRQWQEQRQAWQQSWDDTWQAATGTDEERARLELDELLHSFVEEIRQTAKDHGRVDTETLTAARTILEETADRLFTELFRRRDPS